MVKEIEKDTNAQEDVAKSKYALRDIYEHIPLEIKPINVD